MRNRRLPILVTPVFIAAALLLPLSIHAELLVDCDQGQTSGDGLARGFYVPDYVGSTLDAVDLYFASNVAGIRTFELVVREGSYDGPLVGFAEATVELPADLNGNVQTRFEFGDAATTPGSTLTFEATLIGGVGPMVYAVGATPGSCPAIQTNGVEPPLDAFRRDGVRVRLFGQPAVATESLSWSTMKSEFE